jgi:hypothetical protein
MDLLPFVHMSPVGFAGKKRVGGLSLRGNAEVPFSPSAQRMPTGRLANLWHLDALKRFDSHNPQRVMEITFEVARLGERLSRRHKDTEKSSRPERRCPRRHQHLRERQVWLLGDSAKKCVNTWNRPLFLGFWR